MKKDSADWISSCVYKFGTEYIIYTKNCRLVLYMISSGRNQILLTNFQNKLEELFINLYNLQYSSFTLCKGSK